MLSRSVSRLLILLVVAPTVLLAHGPVAADEPQAAAPIHCVYLPMISTAGAGTAAGSAQREGACPPAPDALPTLRGSVQLRPEHLVIDQVRQPVQYVVVLDQSGSMSANFKGQCDSDSSANPNPPAQNFPGEPAAFWQCTNGPLYDSDGDGSGDTGLYDRVTPVGPTYHWANVNERRITVAKRAVETLIKLTNMPGNVSYDGNPPDQMALVWFNTTVQRNGNNEVFANGTAFGSDPNELIATMWARTTGVLGDIYRTQGGTNATGGLYRASMLLDAAPTQVEQDGRTYTYRRIVVLITDGVTSQLFHPERSDLRVASSDDSTYPNGHLCKSLGLIVLEDADCQTTTIGGLYTTTVTIDGANRQVTLDRPMTQLATVSKDVLQARGVAVAVVAISTLPTALLANAVASFPSYFFSAQLLVVDGAGRTNVDQIMNQLPGGQIEENCRAVVTPAYVATMQPANRPEVFHLSFPNVGLVTLKDVTNGDLYTTTIVAAADGTLSYMIDPPGGTYTMNATLYYRGDDGLTRAYQLFDMQDTLKPSIVVNVSGADTNQFDLKLRLNGNVCAQSA